MKKIKFRRMSLERILLSIVLIFAFFLRVFRLGRPSLWVDEATSSVAAKMILIKGLPIFDSGMLYSRAYLFHYLQAFFLLFGNTDFLVRFVSVIVAGSAGFVMVKRFRK
jgi:predicted membrane-bound mannosyltransferase